MTAGFGTAAHRDDLAVWGESPDLGKEFAGREAGELPIEQDKVVRPPLQVLHHRGRVGGFHNAAWNGGWATIASIAELAKQQTQGIPDLSVVISKNKAHAGPPVLWVPRRDAPRRASQYGRRPRTGPAAGGGFAAWPDDQLKYSGRAGPAGAEINRRLPGAAT
jgi:hypothetical protein